MNKNPRKNNIRDKFPKIYINFLYNSGLAGGFGHSVSRLFLGGILGIIKQ